MASEWARASEHHMERDGWTICRVGSKQQIRYELYGNGRYWGWRESAKEAMELFDQVKEQGE